MKLVRFVAEHGEVLYGSADGDDPQRARLVTGAPFGTLSLGRETAKIERLLPPVDPVNLFAVGLNYRKHAEEASFAVPKVPIIFMKATTSVIGSGAPIFLPLAGPNHVDYEGELAVIIGRTVKNISPAEAVSAIAGYACANDVSARDWQTEKQQGQWVRAKSFDTFCPLGPCIATPDEVPARENLTLRTLLNGQVVQEARTSEMLFSITTLVSDLSRSMTLRAGTVILTGTPEGVGFSRTPPLYLRAGDIVAVEIEGIGRLWNPVAVEQVHNMDVDK